MFQRMVHLPHDRVEDQAVVDTVMNIYSLQKARDFWTT
jgi:hypothetical protein